MTALDIFVLLLMGGGAVFGFLRGFTQEVLALAAWILVIIGVRFLHTPVTDVLVAPVGSESGAAVLAFASIGIVIYSLGRWLARSIGRKSRKSVLGPIDRVLGFGFGLIKGLIIATLAYLLVMLVYDTVFGADSVRPEWLKESRTYPLLHASGNAIVEFVQERRLTAGDEPSAS